MLIKSGIDIDRLDIDGRAALHRSAEHGAIHTNNTLNNTHFLNFIICSFLFFAGNVEVSEVLVKHKANLNILDNYAETPLGLAKEFRKTY